MSKTLKICVVSGSRAEYGLLKPVMQEIDRSSKLDLCLILTGMHLNQIYGKTETEISQDGFQIQDRVETLKFDDTGLGIAQSVGMGVSEMAKSFHKIKPDIVLLLGDRFEIHAAAQAAFLMKIPVAHLCGGDVTTGALDDAMRHSITKMASLHFPMTEDSARRIHQMGEPWNRITCAGNPALDVILNFHPYSKEETQQQLSFEFLERNILITYHPCTLGEKAPRDAFAEVLAALEETGEQTGLIFTGPNADHHGQALIEMTQKFVKNHNNSTFITSMGGPLYWSALHYVDMVVGNSSSGLLEVPSFNIPTINIGTRQDGRYKTSSVIDCDEDKGEIMSAIKRAFEMDCSQVQNPYGDGKAAVRIVQTLEEVENPQTLLVKTFADLTLQQDQAIRVVQ